MMTTTPSACIQVKEGTHFAPVVLMPGDPLRAKVIAETYLENPVLVNDVRNMLAYTGTYEGKEVSVMGSGMGVPSIGLYVHELFSFLGVEAVIRVGSAGGIGEDVRVRDLVIGMSASTNCSFVSAIDLPGILAPTADYEMLRLAVEAAEEIGARTKVGTIYSSDFFYHPDTKVNEKLRDLGVLAVEMEAAGLYLQAMRLKKRALAVCTISDHVFTGESLTPLERQESFKEMMEVCLKTAVRMHLPGR